MTTIEQLVGITTQHNEIIKRIGNGSLDPGDVKRALQQIIEGKFALPLTEALAAAMFAPPSWWRAPVLQLERAARLWPDVALPKPPAQFVPRSKTEVLLLHVPDSFESLWDKIVVPDGYMKRCSNFVRVGEGDLRFTPGKTVYTEPVWLAFDPECGRGKQPDASWGRPDVAGPEVLSALIQFPNWALEWSSPNGPSVPNLAGYQFNNEGEWSSVLDLKCDDDHCLCLHARPASSSLTRWASPLVREC